MYIQTINNRYEQQVILQFCVVFPLPEIAMLSEGYCSGLTVLSVELKFYKNE